VFKLLADETRLRILMYLAQSGELNVTELCDRLGQSQPAVSHHLALMRVAGLIGPRKDGKHNYYSVRETCFQELMRTLAPSVGGKLRRLRFHDFVLSYEGQ
jgi:ArsR family transcriptional regulator